MAIETISIKDAADVIRTVLADLIGTDYAQVLKVSFGTDGSLTLVDASNGLPVAITGTPAVSISGTPAFTVSGTPAVSISGTPAVSISGVPHVILDSGALSSALPTGANTIGAVGINAGSNLMGQVDLNSVPAADATTDSTSSKLATDKIMNNLTPLTPKFAKLVASSSGVTQVVAAVASKKLRVLSLAVVANAAVNVKFQSHTIPTDLTGLHYLAANGGFVLPFNPVGWFETVAGEALDVNLSGAIAVGGSLSYIEV